MKQHMYMDMSMYNTSMYMSMHKAAESDDLVVFMRPYTVKYRTHDSLIRLYSSSRAQLTCALSTVLVASCWS